MTKQVSSLDNRIVMNKSKIFFVVCLTTAIILSMLSIVFVSAQNTSMTTQQIEQVRSNCISAKNTLNQLHSSDALLRVNMGQMYESMSTKLMDRFNVRISSSGFSNTDLVDVSKNYGHTLNTFRLDYIAYEEQLALAIGIDCPDQPIAFYDAVQLARSKRDQLNTDIITLNQYIDNYQSGLIQFEKDYILSSEAEKQ